jgi:hypothetical protein
LIVITYTSDPTKIYPAICEAHPRGHLQFGVIGY